MTIGTPLRRSLRRGPLGRYAPSQQRNGRVHMSYVVQEVRVPALGIAVGIAVRLWKTSNSRRVGMRWSSYGMTYRDLLLAVGLTTGAPCRRL